MKRSEVLTVPDGLYGEFAARFPYAETEDQQNAIDAVEGCDTKRVALVTFALSGVLAAIAGSLIAPLVLVFPLMGAVVILKAFVIVILPVRVCRMFSCISRDFKPCNRIVSHTSCGKTKTNTF